MRKYFITGCAYLLIFCIPLHLSASVSGGSASHGEGDADVEVNNSVIEGGNGEQLQESIELFGPGKSRRQRHKAKVKRMGNHQNLADRMATRGIFDTGKKKDGAAKSALFMIVPAVAVVGLALLFASSTKDKNATPLPDPTDTN